MQETTLTREQQEKVDKIKKEWMDEVEALPEFVPKATFDQSRDIELAKIAEKYRKRIQEVLKS